MGFNTWANIAVNLSIGLVTTFLLVVVYEVARRIPSFSEALFDHKRSIRPHRIPPPLMRSRSRLAGSTNRRWPALLEFLFFSLSIEYIDYSNAMNEEEKKDTQTGGKAKVSERLDVTNLPIEFSSSFSLEPKLFSLEDSKHRDFRLLQTDSYQEEQDATIDEVLGYSGDKRVENIDIAASYPFRCKYFCLPLNLTGPHSVVSLLRMWVKKDNGRHKQVHLGSLILQTQRLSTLSYEDAELLRYIGLDSFIMIRFLRFGFEVCALFFLLACLVLVPTYYSSDYTGVNSNNFSSISDEPSRNNLTVVTYGYYRVTIDRLEPGSSRLVVPFLFSIVFHTYILLRWLLEWRVIVRLIHDFLADGDPGAIGEDETGSLRQHRNSILVENIPPLYRTDEDIADFYEKLFPGHVRRAELVINSRRLKNLIDERLRYLEAYESQYCKLRHAWHRYDEKRRENISNESRMSTIRKSLCPTSKIPTEPFLYVIADNKRTCCGSKIKVKALPYYLQKIDELNDTIESEHKMILEKRGEIRTDGAHQTTAAQSRAGLNCSNGFVEFTDRAIKSSAIQCNLTGEADLMTSLNVPDPRDIIWDNATMDRSDINKRHIIIDILLGLGILFWSAFVTMITNFVNKILADDMVQKFSVLGNLIKNYLPVLIISIILCVLPVGLQVLGCKVIRMKSMSDVEKFVFHWNFGYHIMNLCVILVSGTLIKGLYEFTQNPEAITKRLASGLLAQSQFYFDIVIIATFQTLPLQLSQIISICVNLILTNFITLDALSERRKEGMKEPKRFLFGRYCPQFVYCFAIAILFSATVPLILGACAIYFFLATKVYMHQSLFVFVQKCEGGGSLMKSLSRSLFVTVYISILVFGVVLSLKSSKSTIVLTPLFAVIMLVFTVLIQRYIKKNFIAPSSTLPLARARLIDMDTHDKCSAITQYHPKETTVQMACKSSLICKGMGSDQPAIVRLDNFYIYRQPELNKLTWETTPRACTGLEQYYRMDRDNQ